MKVGSSLFFGVVCTAVTTACSMFATFAPAPTAITPRDAAAMIHSTADPQMAPLILDVRPNTNWRDSHLAGARWIPILELEDRIDEIESFRETPIIVYSHAGKSSFAAATVLQSQGFTQVLVLDGGLVGWVKAGLPVERESSAAASASETTR